LTGTIYITGTDTGIGKTHVSSALLRTLRSAGIAAVGMKPVASGCEATPHGLRNEDALALIAAAGGGPRYEDVNPYAFADPIAPHLAAADAGIVVDPKRIAACFGRLRATADLVVVEGVGGWLAPLGDALMQADFVRMLKLQVVLVVGLRLGCLNHALLSVRSIEADGCELIGWIGNAIDPDMARRDDNIATLQARIQAPLLGVIQHGLDTAPFDGATDMAIEPLLAAMRATQPRE
jgi:dethiobiotin synthetase